MRYFVTGGTGFVGSHLIHRLLSDGHAVVALVRDPSRAGALADAGAELAEGDITERDSLHAPMAGADGIFHLAALYAIGIDPERAARINVEGTRNVLEVMRQLGIRKGVYTSTLAVNSDTDGRRVDESYRHDGPHLSAYDETKWRAHYEVAEPLVREGLPLVTVMPGVIYGPGDTSQVGDLLRQALRGERVVLPGPPTGACWAHVDDVVDGHVRAMEEGTPGEEYIIAGPCHTFKDAFETAARVAGKDLKAVFVAPGLLRTLASVMAVVEKALPVPAGYSAEAMRATGGTTYYGDNGKAKRELGYAPRDLEQGFRDLFAAEPPPS